MTPPFLSELRSAYDRAGGRPLAQAATVSPSGRPEVRTVVLRGLDPAGCPYFASDARSRKFASLAAAPWLELCLWDAAAGEQWRLAGRAALHAVDGLALAVWGALSPEGRSLFFSPTPGEPLPDEPGRPAPAAAGGAAASSPPASFAVVRTVCVRAERLVLGPPLRRRSWALGGDRGWTVRDLVP